MKKNTTHKSYNLKLTKEAYFKLMKIKLEKEAVGISETKNDIINNLILSHE